MRLTHAALGPMLARGHGRIINVASVAAFVPRSTYGAVKAWVVSFSRWANGAYSSRGVTVTAVCPGFTHTNFHERLGLPPGQEGVVPFLWLNAEDVVREGLRMPLAARPSRSRRSGTRSSSARRRSFPPDLWPPSPAAAAPPPDPRCLFQDRSTARHTSRAASASVGRPESSAAPPATRSIDWSSILLHRGMTRCTHPAAPMTSARDRSADDEIHAGDRSQLRLLAGSAEDRPRRRNSDPWRGGSRVGRRDAVPASFGSRVVACMPSADIPDAASTPLVHGGRCVRHRGARLPDVDARLLDRSSRTHVWLDRDRDDAGSRLRDASTMRCARMRHRLARRDRSRARSGRRLPGRRDLLRRLRICVPARIDLPPHRADLRSGHFRPESAGWLTFARSQCRQSASNRSSALRLHKLGIRLDSQVSISGVGYVDFVVAGLLILEVDGKENHEAGEAS